MTIAYTLDTRDRPLLLFAMMHAFASNQSLIAFEGNLRGTELFSLKGASHEEVGRLKRATVVPQLDFVVLPLSLSSVDQIEKAIRSKIAFNGYKGIIHTQIEVDGELAFTAYDNFAEECVVVNGRVSRDLLDDLVSTHVLRSYSEQRGS